MICDYVKMTFFYHICYFCFIGRTPGPGDYDVKSYKKAGAASFPKGQRFSDSSDTESVGGCDSMLAAVKSKPEFKIPHTTRPVSYELS